MPKAEEKVVLNVISNPEDSPKKLIEIQLWWKSKADAYGDKGSCVVGARFEFTFDDQNYIMYPISGWQGSSSWEAFVPEVKKLLEDVGAQNVVYHWGRMD